MGIHDEEKVKAFLDDLTRVCLKHGFFIDTSAVDDAYDQPYIHEIRDVYAPKFRGYNGCAGSGMRYLSSVKGDEGPVDVIGTDIADMSAHERLRFIHGMSEGAA
jgi:hypothetical protein